MSYKIAIIVDLRKPINMIKKTDDLFKIRNNLKDIDVSIVPTMGHLHQGHLSLIEESLKNHLVTFVTIFVNPKQFAPNEDFDNYPRTLEEDLLKIDQLKHRFKNKKIFIFAPENILQVFPNDYDTTVKVEKLSALLCGKSRPTHFSGVTTVVYRLFSLIRPKIAYFGLKDYQQYIILKKMAKDLSLDVTIKGCPIVRDYDGLALSSRNYYLEPKERDEALTLYKTIKKISELYLANKDFLNFIRSVLNENYHFEYLEILDGYTLTPINSETKKVVILGAYKLGKTRLIDNIIIDKDVRRI